MLAPNQRRAIFKSNMALERLNETTWRLSPGPFDAHGHPRLCDAINYDDFNPINEGKEGKAGPDPFSREALSGGITGINAMPNESLRLLDKDAEDPEATITVPYPIANLDRVRTMQNAINQQSVIPMGVYMGLDPETAMWGNEKARVNRPHLAREFSSVSDECLGLKVYLAQTTGGYAIDLSKAAEVAELWHRNNPEKPIIYHVEGLGVPYLMRELSRLRHGTEMPTHLAHVSSKLELSAKMKAEDYGMNVSCEVTPHHLFMNDAMAQFVGGYGCVKPRIKSEPQRRFMWDNIDRIEMFASDCAPHRRSDKEAAAPAFGITNHKVMIPLLLGAVADGRLTMEDIYQKFCIAPRERFNLPLNDGSYVVLSTAVSHSVERYEQAEYGYSPFGKLPDAPKMIGEVVVAHAGRSTYHANREQQDFNTSYTHLIRPKNLIPKE